MRTRGLVFAMEESEVVDLPQPDAVEQQVAEATAEVEATTAETVEQVGEVEEVTAAVEEAVADADTLEEVQDVMAESVERGEGLDETSAQIAEVAVEAICVRLGVQKRVMPAMESFGSKNSRVAATKIAMEGIGDTLKRVWEAIKKAFKTVWERITDFFTKFFANTEAVKKLAEKLKTKATALNGTSAKEATLKVGGLAAMVGFGTKADAGSAKEILDNQVAVTTSFLAAGDGIANAIVEVNNALKAGEKIGDKLEAAISGSKELSKAILKNGKSEDKDGSSVTTVGPLVGGVSIVVSTGKVNSVEVVDGDKSKAETLPVLSLADCVSLCDAVTVAMDVTENFKKAKSVLDKLNKVALAATDAGLSYASKIGTDATAEVSKHATEARKSLVGMNNMATRLITMLPSWNVKAGKAVLSYVGKSLDQYKKEETKAA